MPHSSEAIETIYRAEWGRIVGALIRMFGDFELAEDAAQEAFGIAVERWPESGIPEFPRAWIIQTARNRAIDRLRRRSRADDTLALHAASSPAEHWPTYDTDEIPDERLRLIFTCCHPALAVEAQIALTLRTLCGLTVEQIARAFLVQETAMAQRIVRAKRKIRDAGIPYRVPTTTDMPARLRSVLRVIYLVFNEGYAPTRGDSWVRSDLCAEAIGLGRLLRALLPPTHASGEVSGLLALMLLHDARRDARVGTSGELRLLEEQDRRKWHHGQIREALPLVEEALRARPGPFALQAAIVAVHCEADSAEHTDWPQILRLYDILLEMEPSPVIALNRAVAVAMVRGPEAALDLVDRIAATGDLDPYHLLHATRAELLRRLDMRTEAAASYARAFELATNDTERQFLRRRLHDLTVEDRSLYPDRRS